MLSQIRMGLVRSWKIACYPPDALIPGPNITFYSHSDFSKDKLYLRVAVSKGFEVPFSF